MTESPNADTTATSGAAARPPRRRRLLTRALLFGPAVLVFGFAVASGAGLFTDAPSTTSAPPPLELGDVTWRSVDVEPSTTGEGFTIRASVDDDRLEGERADEHSPYVLWMLANGRFDDRPWTDSWNDEDTLGMSHDEQLTLIPVGEGESRQGLVENGHFTPSVDGEISYDRIPAGEYTLRALVLREGGYWDGSIVTRRIVVE